MMAETISAAPDVVAKAKADMEAPERRRPATLRAEILNQARPAETDRLRAGRLHIADALGTSATLLGCSSAASSPWVSCRKPAMSPGLPSR
jgi:hypothetical protein